jgi:diaminohydroxyphosphoribosylaminopyrimidine deaminase/5-amino-6-(5-phosphoribosylamino)uracil reductase
VTPAQGDDCLGAACLQRSDSDVDALLLERTLDLAELGRPGARPNPVVGAVLARPDATVLATGHHVRRGAPHAERELLADFTEPVPEDATLYVSLEPCSHHGLTPPCVDVILERGVRRVVFASCDPNPDTAGHGPRRLAEAGVQVERGRADVERRALQQNAGFHSVHLRGRPYVTAKWAMTPNGRLATGDPERRWISGEQSRAFVHYLRAGSGAIACGIGTVLADDPLLTVRGAVAERTPVPPIRVVYDRQLRLPLDPQLVRSVEDAPVLLVCAHDASADRQLAFEAAGVEVWRAPDDATPGAPGLLAASLPMLAEHRINDLLLEAGPSLLDAFADEDLVDAAIAFVGGEPAPDDQPGLDLDHPLVTAVLAQPAQPSGDDAMHVAVLHPAWEFPGATCD